MQKLLEIINRRIEVLYDREHTIGHAYFCGLKGKNATLAGLKDVFKKSVLPLLQEYFFDDYEKIAMVLGDNQKSNRDYKFIVEDNGKDIHALFGKDLEEDMDCLVEYVQPLGRSLRKAEEAPATIQYKYSYEKKCSIPVVKIRKYVGELELKSGLRLQILPKIYFGGSEDRTKQIYLEMLKSTYRLKEKAMSQISLGTGDMELFEAYIRMYLAEVQMLVKRGLRSAYEEKTDNLRCRGISVEILHIKRDSM